MISNLQYNNNNISVDEFDMIFFLSQNSLKQGWKLYIIMIGHTLIDVPDDILEIKVVE